MEPPSVSTIKNFSPDVPTYSMTNSSWYVCMDNVIAMGVPDQLVLLDSRGE